MAVKGKELVEKRNVLNEVRKNNMSLQELRFFSIYLSKINARDVSTRTVRFPLKDFQKIMDFGRLNTTQLKATTDSLLSKVVSIPTEHGGYKSFQLFKECTVDKDEFDQWYIEIDAHDRALPLMFDFKDRYFTYELWNALQLKSGNQLRMYELLKQYESVGERKVTLAALKELLGISSEEYPRWDNFKRRVIDSCQEALRENTDICFDYEPIKSGRKISGIRFIIKKNKSHVDKLSLDEFIDKQDVVMVYDDFDFEDNSAETAIIDERYRRNEICFGFEDEIFDEFNDDQLKELRSLAWDKSDPAEVEMQNKVLGDAIAAKEYAVAAYIRSKVLMCNAKGKGIVNRYSFIRSAVSKNWE